MRRARVTINASVLAAAVRIDRVREAHVRAIVLCDDRAAGIAKVLRRWRDIRIVFRAAMLRLRIENDRIKSIRRILRRAATVDGKRNG